MGIIFQATQRLEALARSGVRLPWSVGATNGSAAAPSAMVRPLRTDTPSIPPAPRSTANPRHDEPARRVEIDLERLADAGYVVPDQRGLQLADEFRLIKRELLVQMRDAPRVHGVSNTITVTSALQGEGKTFCAVNLAMSLAMEVDTSVLLVDADVLKPSAVRRLGVEAEEGLLDVLDEPQRSVSSVILSTNVPNLSLLPAGRSRAHAHELLASEGMKRLVANLASVPNRVVVFDAPALLLTTEACTLASLAAQVVLVVAAGQTPRRSVAQAMAALMHCPQVFPLLNRSRFQTDGRRYGEYYEAAVPPSRPTRRTRPA